MMNKTKILEYLDVLKTLDSELGKKYDILINKPYDVTTLESKPKFEVGKWYKCNCNKNFYRFKEIQKDKYFVNDAVINPTDNKCGSEYPGYRERLEEKSLLEYFDPKNVITDLSKIQQYLPNSHPDKFVNKPDIQVTNNILIPKPVKQIINVQVYPETKINIPLNKNTKKSKIIQITI